MKSSSASKTKIQFFAGMLASISMFCGSGCAINRLGSWTSTKTPEALPYLEIETNASPAGEVSGRGTSAAGLISNDSQSLAEENGHLPDSVKLTELLQQAELEPKEAKWQSALAQQYLEMEQPLLAEQAAIKAIGLNQQCGEAWVIRGELSEQREDWLTALRCYQQALSTQSGEADWQARVARCYEQLGEHRRALSALERAEQLYPTGKTPSDLKIRRARLLAELRQYRRAIAELQQVLSRPTQDATPWIVLSEVQALSGDTSGARVTLARAKELFPHDPVVAKRQQPPSQSDQPIAAVR